MMGSSSLHNVFALSDFSRLHLQKVPFRMSFGSIKFHSIAVSHVCSDLANVYCVRSGSVSASSICLITFHPDVVG